MTMQRDERSQAQIDADLKAYNERYGYDGQQGGTASAAAAATNVEEEFRKFRDNPLVKASGGCDYASFCAGYEIALKRSAPSSAERVATDVCCGQQGSEWGPCNGCPNPEPSAAFNGECICPKCGIRHGGVVTDGGDW